MFFRNFANVSIRWKNIMDICRNVCQMLRKFREYYFPKPNKWAGGPSCPVGEARRGTPSRRWSEACTSRVRTLASRLLQSRCHSRSFELAPGNVVFIEPMIAAAIWTLRVNISQGGDVFLMKSILTLAGRLLSEHERVKTASLSWACSMSTTASNISICSRTICDQNSRAVTEILERSVNAFYAQLSVWGAMPHYPFKAAA